MADWAFAGAGWIAAVHGLAVQAAGSRVVAVASRTESSARRRAEETGGQVVTYDDLPAGADLVAVATPPARHVEDALHAIAGGASVLVEKPLCTTLEDADRLVRVVEAGAVCTYAENLLFADATAEALTQIAMLGPLRHLSARTLQPRPSWGAFTSRGWGGGVFFDLGAHPVALVLRAARSAAVAVTARFDASPDIEVEDLATVDLTFASGLRARIETSWRDEHPTWDLQAASDTGAVRLELLPDLSLERNGEPVEVSPTMVPAPDSPYPPQLEQFGYIEQIRAAERAHREGRSPALSDVRLGRDVLEIVCAASTAARTGATVALPFTGPRDRTPIELWRP